MACNETTLMDVEKREKFQISNEKIENTNRYFFKYYYEDFFQYYNNIFRG